MKPGFRSSTSVLYVNDVLVHSGAYTESRPNWTSVSSLVLGAQNPSALYLSGAYALDDAVAEFKVR